jgi:hypothetical protein
MTSRFFFTAFCLFCTCISSFALEPKNPTSLCERFIEGPDRSQCEKKMTVLKPDWYLATVCNDNFDDLLFYECLNLNKLGSFSPEKLNDCMGDQLSDPSRNDCVRKALTTEAKSFQNAKPKGSPQKKKK